MSVEDTCCLTPVEILEDGNEVRSHLFKEYGLTYSVLAWNFKNYERVITVVDIEK